MSSGSMRKSQSPLRSVDFACATSHGEESGTDGNLKIFVQPVSIRTMPSNEKPVVSLLGHHGVCCAHSGREVSLKSLSRPFVLLVL